MKTILVLARGDYESFHKLNGESIFKDMPFKSVLLVDRGNEKQLAGLEGNIECCTVRWNDKTDVLNKATELHLTHKFSAVATLDESNVQVAAELRASLNIPGMRPSQASWFRDKVAMKQKLMESDIRVPHFCSCSNEDDVTRLLSEYRCIVIKPVDGFGSKEVAIINNRDELQAWFEENAAVLKHFEAEEFISGQLFHVNALVVNGETRLTAPASYLPGMSNIDFTKGTPFVSVIQEEASLKQALIDYSDSVNKALQLENGVTHLECFVSDQGEIVFCEVGLRPGGGGIVWMIESQYGINYSQATLAVEAGYAEELPQINASKAGVAGLIGIRTNLSGFVKQCPSLEDFQNTRIRLKQISVANGAFKAASAHCTDFLSLFVFDSNTTEEFHNYWQLLQQQFQEKLVFNCI